MTSHRSLLTGLAGALLVLSGCGESGRAPMAIESDPAAPLPGRTLTHAGLTVRLPAGCDAGAVSPGTCSGLRRLRIEVVGELDDLIRPGVHRTRDGWVGLRTVGDAYVFATANNGPVIRDLLDSAVQE